MTSGLAANIPPGLFDQEYDRCDSALRRGDAASVTTAANEMLADPASSEDRRCAAQMFLGTIAFWEGRANDALPLVTAGARGPEPVRSRSLAVLAAIRLSSGDRGSARALLESAVAANPESTELWSALGAVESAEGNTAAAWEAYCRGHRCDPGALDALRGMLSFGMAPGRFETLSAALRRFVDREPENLSVRAYLAACLLGEGRDAEAAAEVERIAVFAPFAPIPEESKEVLRSVAAVLQQPRGV